MLTLRFNDDGQQQSKAAIFNLQHIAVVFVAVHFHWQQRTREKKITHFWGGGHGCTMLPHRFQDVLKGSFSWSAPSGSSHTHNNHLLKESAFIGNVNNNTHKKKSRRPSSFKHFFFVGPDSGKCQRQLRGRSARQQQLASVPCSSSLLYYSYVSLFSVRLFCACSESESISSRLTSKKKRGASRSSPISSFRSLCEYWMIV